MVVHYFLADDTMEIREVLEANSGRDGPSVFVRRQKLPKDSSALVKAPGAVSERTLLNVFAPSGFATGARSILDNIQTGSGATEQYKASDLAIGKEVNVFGRRLLLCDCDEFTKSYYRETQGVQDFTPIDLSQPMAALPEAALPPPTGYGTDEDSLTSVYSLVPKAPKKEFTKWYREGNSTLQFRAKLAPGGSDPELDAERDFAIIYYLADDTMAIFEERRANSGLDGGKFLARCRCPSSSQPGHYYDLKDMQLQTTLRFSGRDFQLVEASPFTLHYMQEHGVWAKTA